MKRNLAIGLFAIGVVGVAAVGALFVFQSLYPDEQARAKGELRANHGEGIAFPSAIDVSRHLSRRTDLSKAADAVPGVPQTRAGQPLESDMFIATSSEEQQWLDRNGFPNNEQYAVYSKLSDAALEVAAEKGGRVAATMLANRKLIRGEPGAADELLALSVEGSSYALDVYAAYMAGSSQGNPKTAWALSRVEEMRGNMRLALSRNAMFPTPLSQADQMEAEAEALNLFATLRQLHVEMYGSDKGWTDPRPYSLSGDGR